MHVTDPMLKRVGEQIGRALWGPSQTKQEGDI
jgi:hypothetical protein